MSFTAWAMDGYASDAQVIRQSIGSLIGSAGGLVAAGDLALTQKGTPNMSVQVAAGSCWVPGFSAGGVNPYFVRNSATYERTIVAAGAANPRVDTIVVRMLDEVYEGASHEPVIEALKGAEETGATLANRKGAASVPSACLVLGYVLVPAKASSIVTADIENVATAFLAIGGVGEWVNVPLETTTVANGRGHNARLEAGGQRVALEGELLVKAGKEVAARGLVMTLPAGLRPSAERIIACWAGSQANLLTIGTNGEVAAVKACPAASVIVLDGLSFPV